MKPLNKDISLFEEIYTTYFPVLLNYAVGVTKDLSAAEDVVSEVFLTLWEQQGNLNIEKSVKAYLFKSVYHQSLNTLNRNKVHDRYEEYLKHIRFLNEENGDYPLSGLIEMEITEIMQKSIESLPEQCRLIFTMSRNENMTHEEIAQKLGISVNTVHTQIRRALVRLRLDLKDYLPLLLLILIQNRFGDRFQ